MGRLVRLLVVILSPLLLWVAFVCFHREALDPGQADFYRLSRAADRERDAAVFLDGLNAPKGNDVLQHGLQVQDIYRTPDNAVVARQMVAALRPIEMQLDPDELDCWIGGLSEAVPKQPCASPVRIQALLDRNSILLARYRAMTSLDYFGVGYQNGQLFINLNKLIAAQTLLEAQGGKVEQGYRRWRDNFLFLNRIAGSRSTWIGKAIVLVNYGISQATLERLLFEHPELAIRHKDELLSILSPEFDIWRVDETIRGERQMLEEQFFARPLAWYFDKNFLRNRLYRADTALLEVLRNAQPGELEEAVQSALKPYADRAAWTSDYLLNPLGTISSRLLIGGYPKFGALLTAMWDKTGYNRLLRLRVLLANSSMRGTDIARFVEDKAVGLSDPFSGQPMAWAATQKVLWFGYRECYVVREVRLPGGRFFSQNELNKLSGCA